jgi:hypothetical protein
MIKPCQSPAAVAAKCALFEKSGTVAHQTNKNQTEPEQVEQLDVIFLRQGGVGKQARKSLTVRDASACDYYSIRRSGFVSFSALSDQSLHSSLASSSNLFFPGGRETFEHRSF